MSNKLNQSVHSPDISDMQDFENCLKGLVAQKNPAVITNSKGDGIWDLDKFDFVPDIKQSVDYQPDDCPETVNESLWRQAKLNKIHGLFEVCSGVYQVRGYDLANMTIVEGEAGVIVIDCTTYVEAAEAALDLYKEYKKLSTVRVSAIILTHTHVDHFGGIGGVLKYGENIPIYAPEGFMTEALLENVFVGEAMTRRSFYQYGSFLKPGEEGQVDSGLGKTVAHGGTVTIVKPTNTITEQSEKQIFIDGVQFEFMLCPDTEAPAEMTIFFQNHEKKRILLAAEIATHTLHNLLTPRGAQVRDARLWWKALDKLLTKYDDVDIVCAVHHWPTWGNENCRKFLKQQRDTYKFLHDQTVRLINKGYTMLEIAAKFEEPGFLPDFMMTQWHNRGYYGTISHNVRAIYQKYIGWYDMNPSNLNPLPPEEVAKRYVEAMGGEEKVRKMVIDETSNHNVRWAAEIGKHLVFFNPSEENRQALAKTYKVLGYQCECGSWRNMYLTGAVELENGGPLLKFASSTINPSILEAMDDDMLYDFISCRFKAEDAIASKAEFIFDVKQTDKNKTVYCVESACGLLNFHDITSKDKEESNSGSGQIFARLELDRSTFVKLILEKDEYTVQKAVNGGKATVFMNNEKNSDEAINEVSKLFELIDTVLPNFNIVLP